MSHAQEDSDLLVKMRDFCETVSMPPTLTGGKVNHADDVLYVPHDHDDSKPASIVTIHKDRPNGSLESSFSFEVPMNNEKKNHQAYMDVFDRAKPSMPDDKVYMDKFRFWAGVRNDPEDRIDPHCDDDYCFSSLF